MFGTRAASRGVAGGRTVRGFGNPRYSRLGSLRYARARALAFVRLGGKLARLQAWFDKHHSRIRRALALVAGLLLAAAFPRSSIAGLAWIGPGLLLFAALGTGGKRAFGLGYLGGLAFCLPTLYWLLHMPVGWEKVLGWLALCAYLAVYSGVWVWLCWRLFPGNVAGNLAPIPAITQPARDSVSLSPAEGERAGVRGLPIQRTISSHPFVQPPLATPHFALLEAFAATPRLARLRWAFTCAVVWVALEMIVGRLFTGFPFLALGVSQYRILPVTQIASITAVYGVSFLLVWFSVGLASALLLLVRQPQQRGLAFGDVMLPALAVAAACSFGMTRLAVRAPAEREIKIALVQPSIPQRLLWDPGSATNRFEKLLALSRTALATKPDLLIWPEAAVPGLLRYDKFIGDAVSRLAEENQVAIILGADDLEPDATSADSKAVRVFNSSFLINRAGRLVAKYDKRHLVIFGEYIPLVKWLPFLKWVTPIGGGFGTGEAVVPFELERPRARTAVLICFEDVLPHLARQYVSDDTDFLVNLTNDGWFSESAQQWQHAAVAVFRAIENGVPLVRCTNNGLTCWIDPCGRLDEDYFRAGKDIYGEGFKTVRIPLLPEGERRALTYYTRHGDVFGWACVALAALRVLPLAWGSWRERKRRAGQSR